MMKVKLSQRSMTWLVFGVLAILAVIQMMVLVDIQWSNGGMYHFLITATLDRIGLAFLPTATFILIIKNLLGVDE